MVTENFSLGLITASGSIGLLFPPSLPLILMGLLRISISIFLAGIIPGVFLIVILSIWSYLSGDAKKIQVSDFDGAAALKICWRLNATYSFDCLCGIFGGHTNW